MTLDESTLVPVLIGIVVVDDTSVAVVVGDASVAVVVVICNTVLVIVLDVVGLL